MRLRRLSVSLLTSFFATTLPSCDRQPESPSSVLSADGVPIHYEVFGSGETALVFVHGWSCDRTYWDAQVPYFSERYRVVTVDLAGHGESGLEREVWSMKAFGQDVAAVVEKHGLEQVVLVGHSMGGLVAVEAARLLSDRVTVVVGADTFGDVSGRISEEQIEAFIQPFLADFSEATRGLVRNQFFVPTSDSALIERIAEDMASAPPGVGVGAFAGYFNWYNTESADALRELRVPVRLINSDYSPTNVDAGREYADDFDAVLMTGVGHFVMMEDPETFNRLLGEIVEELAGT
jgi:pimeloyl-ACP methyl ester carboxylesterase